MQAKLEVTVNGEVRKFGDPAPGSVLELLQELGLAGIPVVVEQNREALLPREHGSAPVADGDVFEIVRVVAGG